MCTSQLPGSSEAKKSEGRGKGGGMMGVVNVLCPWV